MSKDIRRQSLQYLKTATDTFEERKRNAKAEALRQASLAVAAMREDLAKMFWDAQYDGASIADLSTVSGYSRATVYRLIDEHVANTGGNPAVLRDAIAEAKKQGRFVFDGVNSRGEIMVADTITGDVGRLYVGSWKNDWEHNVHGVRDGKGWLEIPELELLVAQVESGSFVPPIDVDRLEAPIRARITGAKAVDKLDSFDWD